jgi:two-component system, cell cycle response regulator
VPGPPSDKEPPPGFVADDFDEQTEVGQFDSTRLMIAKGHDRAYLIVLAGQKLGQMFRIHQSETLIGRAEDATISFPDDGVSRRHAKIVQADGEPWIEDLQSANGTIINGERIQRAALRDGDKIRIGSTVILKFTYADELEENFQKAMYEKALRDELTRAYKMRHLLDRLPSEIAFARRHGTPLSLLMIDIDHFKKVNDCYGHPAGDYVLATLAGIITGALRAEDLFARYGGEEFCVLCRNATLFNAKALAERLRHIVETSAFVCNGRAITITISVGVASWSDRADGGEQVILDADAALYDAKRAGRNRVVARVAS